MSDMPLRVESRQLILSDIIPRKKKAFSVSVSKKLKTWLRGAIHFQKSCAHFAKDPQKYVFFQERSIKTP